MDYKINSMRKVYVISKEREAKGVNVSPLTRASTPHPVGHNIPVNVGVSLVNHGHGQISSRDAIVISEDKYWSPPANTKRVRDLDQSSQLEEDLAKKLDYPGVPLPGRPVFFLSCRILCLLEFHAIFKRSFMRCLKRILSTFIIFLKRRG